MDVTNTGSVDGDEVDPGKYVFEIGASSKDIKGHVEATMSGFYKPVLKTVVADCGKVVLRPGNTVQTSITAAMSDDSFYDTHKAKVAYKTNNPHVASVDKDGKVTATGVGTALISASVTIDGTTVSNSYPLKVMPDLSPGTITVDGKNIEGFNKDVKAYSYLLKSNSKIPVVYATALSSDISVDIDQAKGLPGTTVICFTYNVTLEKNAYYLSFGIESASEEFDSAFIGEQWEWIRENPDNHSASKNKGSLTITSEVQPGTKDLILEENDIAKSVASFNLRKEVTQNNGLTLKLVKTGSIYTAFYSSDGHTFEKLGSADILLKDIRAGLIVCDGTILQNMKSTFWFNPDTTKPDTPFDVAFDYFRIDNSGLK